MIVVPNQFFGIGDIIWEQTVVRKIACNNQIVWPVEPQFIDGLTAAYPDIKFVNKNHYPIDYNRRDEYEINDMVVLPLRWADVIMKVPYSDCMKSKYMMYGMDWQTWKEHAMWKRDEYREKALMARVNPRNEPYCLINRTFGSQSQLKAAIPQVDGLLNIEMKTIAEFSLFDWAYVIESATEIHTVSTSIIYLLELLELKAECVNLYPRKPIEEDFRNVEYILQKQKYVYCL